MSDKLLFQSMSASDRYDLLRRIAIKNRREPFVFEKDIWVVQILKILFDAPFGKDLVFKGGTSLSKVYNAIRRFSEDLDVTYDIRAFAPDIVGDSEEAFPPNRSQEKRWTKTIRKRLEEWTREDACGVIEDGLVRAGFHASGFRTENDQVYITYEPMFEYPGFVRPEVKVEFGARSTGEPCVERPVKCDAADMVPKIVFPSTTLSAMVAERTFWEKATSMHVFCHRRRGRGNRLSRHWHDLVRLDDAGYGDKAFADRELALSVARHKSIFFPEKDTEGNRIDFEASVRGGLRLVPDGETYNLLADDYEAMVGADMLFNDPDTFENLMERCADIEARANKV
ncbi:MAG: nucleotidyl transferase AbiEii/AbiGii toxin family protein [Candidatus Dadabacteria bacterium]|nr:nucleotidyl transferase AbiEii/AbiGii toxin family protein [Candidatus Dadabacteria bacterium]